MGCCFVVSIRLVLTMRLVPTGHLLFFASPKCEPAFIIHTIAFMTQNLFAWIMNTGSKQKKGDPDVQVWLRQTSLTAHPFFRRVRKPHFVRRRTSARFFPKKGCFVRLDVGKRVAVVNGCDGLGSLKPNPSNIQETVWRDTNRFLFFRLPLPVGND